MVLQSTFQSNPVSLELDGRAICDNLKSRLARALKSLVPGLAELMSAST